MNHFDWLVKKVMWLTTSNQSALLQHSVAMLIFAYDIVFWWWNLQNIDVETIAQIRNSWNGWSWCRYSWTRQEDKALPFGGIGKTVFFILNDILIWSSKIGSAWRRQKGEESHSVRASTKFKHFWGGTNTERKSVREKERCNGLPPPIDQATIESFSIVFSDDFVAEKSHHHRRRHRQRRRRQSIQTFLGPL